MTHFMFRTVCFDNIIAAIKRHSEKKNPPDHPPQVGTPIEFWVGSAYYQHEPKGVVLVISAWNYPVLILLDGLITAIAAGNCVLLKPSEVATNCEKFLAENLLKYVDNEAIQMVTGDGAVVQKLLEENKFDHVVFTGIIWSSLRRVTCVG